MNRHFWLLTLGVNDSLAVRHGGMHRATVEDRAINTAFYQPAIQLLLGFTFIEKLRMAHFYAIGEIFRQAVEESPQNGKILWAEGGGQL